MDSRSLLRGITFFVTIFTINYKYTAGESCANGFLDPHDREQKFNQTGLRPLLINTAREQWVFPSMQFTCNGTLTEWIFRELGGHETIPGLQLTTWRLDLSQDRWTYQRASMTNTTTAVTEIYPQTSIISYKLISPIEVRSGDIVGIEVFSTTRGGNNNVLSVDTVNTSSVTVSYRRTQSRRFNQGFRLRSTLGRTSLPLLSAVIQEDGLGDTVTAFPLPPTVSSATPSPGARLSLSGVERATIAVCVVLVVVIVCLITGVVCLARYAYLRKKENGRPFASIPRAQGNRFLRSSGISMQDNTAYKMTTTLHSAETWEEVRFERQSEMYENNEFDIEQTRQGEFQSEYSLVEHEKQTETELDSNDKGFDFKGVRSNERKRTGKIEEKADVRLSKDEYAYVDERQRQMWTHKPNQDRLK